MNDNRVRSPKASECQKEELLRYFEDNPHALRILNGSDNRAKQKIWIELTHKLNTLEGALKTTSKWAKYWNDIIIYTKTRARTFVSGECRCDRPPNEVEQRLLTLIGHLSLLKMWQRMWEQGMEKQADEAISPSKSRMEIKAETGDVHSDNSSIDDLGISEYEKMVIVAEEIPEDDANTSTAQIESPIEPKEQTEAEDHVNAGERENSVFEHFKDNSLVEDLAENVRTIGNSFNIIGSALNNIAFMLEKLSRSSK